MASTSVSAPSPDTMVTLKVNIEGSNRRFKLPLRELGANTLPDKLRFLLAIPPSSDAVFERYSDSAGEFITLDPNNASVYKQLYRAAKAKLKLRLKVTVKDKDKEQVIPKPATVEDEVIEDQCRVPVQTPTVQVAPAPPSVAEIQRGFENLLLNRASVVSAQAQLHAQAEVAARSSASYTHEAPQAPPVSWCGTACSPSNEVPVTRGVVARDQWFAELAGISQDRQSALRSRSGPPTPCQVSTYSVYCNKCQHPIPDEHYHCSTCDGGDFDLCQACIDDGVLCGGEGHWLIKRFVKNGKVINSVTETVAPRMPYAESKATLVETVEVPDSATRTCNSCIQEFPEENFVTCISCDDFDLCIQCHTANAHGHNPSHPFTPAVEGTKLEGKSLHLLNAGRYATHQAICDGCDVYIRGVRHKCLDCPDWDYCSECIQNASSTHSRHRFVPIYEPLNDSCATARAFQNKSRHFGIYCDGPLCSSGSSHIIGDRYKCAVCHDTDFCASCEASPKNLHNKTHPLIKFKTPVRNVSVTTLGDHDNGQPMPVMGDRRGRTTSKSTETTPTPSTNAATQVQTVADLKPSEPVNAEEIAVEEKSGPIVPIEEELVAHFVCDAVPDGSILAPNTVFEQTWILRNGGNKAWPAGCTVKFVGGDNMCAVDPEHPASVHELVSAGESTTCYSEVAPGQESAFTVLMRTPARVGKVISYWRLTGPNGLKFGHRLWCDVTVLEPALKEVKEVKEVEEIKEIKEEANDVQGSHMIFPTLDKESPSTSIHEEVAPAQEPSEADDFEDFVDDEAALDDETEDGFVTDDEYDILDASDEEFLAEQGKALKK